MVDPVFIDTSEGRAVIADSLKTESNNINSEINKKQIKHKVQIETDKPSNTEVKALPAATKKGMY